MIKINKEEFEKIIRECQTSSKKWLKELRKEPMIMQLEFTSPDNQKYQVTAAYKIDVVEVKQVGGKDVTPETVH